MLELVTSINSAPKRA